MVTMWRSTLFCLCAVVCAASAQADVRESRLVHIAQGPVRGYKDPDTGIYFFQSIPYASVPTGRNRFKGPLPPPTWMQPLEAVSRNIASPQPAPGLPELRMQEDCLIASVYVPDTDEKNLPVVVYVHGGAFQVGSGDMVIPSKLVAANNIIAVTFNYRLGTHGFLCLGTVDVPGNAGMKDQVAALRWVKDNVASFGGNPDDVTIAGYSAGSAAVDSLMLSKSAEGLFNKVIPESGASIAQWAIQSDPLKTAKQLAKFFNFTDVDDLNALEDFYKTASFELLTSFPFLDSTDSTLGPSPCIERATGEEVFLDESPADILKSGNYRKLPLLYGFANMEGLLRIEIFDSWKLKMNERFSDFLPADLEFESDKQKEEVAKQIKEFYFEGANHCAQTEAVFGRLMGIKTPATPTEQSIKMFSMIRKIWGSFIKTGKPVPKGSSLPPWPAVGKNWSPHMSLSNEITLKGSLLERRARFWDDIYSKHYRDPIPPPKPSLSHSEL